MIVRAQTVIPFRTGIPEDVVSNTMWFETAAGIDLAEAGEGIAVNIAAFYADVYAAIGGTGIQASYLRLTGAFTNFYDQGAPAPRVPYRVDLGLADAVTSNTRLPTEVACVLSYRASLENGVSAARRRGRIFLGGLGDGAVTMASAASPYFPQFTTGFIAQVISAAEDNLLNPTTWGPDITGSDVIWSVHSRVDGFTAPVVAGWVDNTPDTQRRRGVNATARTVFP
jgi:hypothetical protein